MFLFGAAALLSGWPAFCAPQTIKDVLKGTWSGKAVFEKGYHNVEDGEENMWSVNLPEGDFAKAGGSAFWPIKDGALRKFDAVAKALEFTLNVKARIRVFPIHCSAKLTEGGNTLEGTFNCIWGKGNFTLEKK